MAHPLACQTFQEVLLEEFQDLQGDHQEENPHVKVEDQGQNTSQEVKVPSFLNKVGMEEVDPEMENLKDN